MSIVARVAGEPVPVEQVDAREAQLRRSALAATLPRAGTSEGRQLRRWLTQLLVAERVVAAEAATLRVTAEGAPAEDDLLPDTAARLEIGSVAASVLADPLARALFERVTAAVTVDDADVADYHRRNPLRFAPKRPVPDGWRSGAVQPPPLSQVRAAVDTHLRGAARRREFRRWLDDRCAALVELAPGYEHPGDPRQPDNVHQH